MTRSLPLRPNGCIFLVLMCHFSFSCGNPARPRPYENTAHGKIFSCWSHKEDLHYSVSKHGNEITKACKITWFLQKKCIKKWRVVVLRILQHFCGCFEKHSTGKHKENLRTVCNLFDHWNMALFSDFCHLKTFLATRLVFHLFWRWQPVAHAPFQQPRHAAVLKRSRPRTSDTAMWASLIVAALWCTTAWIKQLSGFASWP